MIKTWNPWRPVVSFQQVQQSRGLEGAQRIPKPSSCGGAVSLSMVPTWGTSQSPFVASLLRQTSGASPPPEHFTIIAYASTPFSKKMVREWGGGMSLLAGKKATALPPVEADSYALTVLPGTNKAAYERFAAQLQENAWVRCMHTLLLLATHSTHLQPGVRNISSTERLVHLPYHHASPTGRIS